MSVRNIKDGPWCWQQKAVLRRIRDAFDATDDVASAICVYVALSEIASDQQAEAFETTHAYISQRSGIGVSTVKKRLPELAEIGAIHIRAYTGIRRPSIYTLLKLEDEPVQIDLSRDSQPMTIDSQSVANVSQQTENAPLATLEESPEQSLEESNKQAELLFSLYPKPTAKLRAIPAIEAAIKRVGFDDLKDKVEAFASEVKRGQTDVKYIPDAHNWFNDERYLVVKVYRAPKLKSLGEPTRPTHPQMTDEERLRISAIFDQARAACVESEPQPPQWRML